MHALLLVLAVAVGFLIGFVIGVAVVAHNANETTLALREEQLKRLACQERNQQLEQQVHELRFETLPAVRES